MLNSKWFAFFVFIYILGMYLGSTFEKHIGTAWSGTSTVTTLQYLTNISNIIVMNPFIGAISIPAPNSEYFTTLVRVMTLNFEFIQGTGYSMLYQIVLTPFAAVGAISLIVFMYQIIQGILPWS